MVAAGAKATPVVAFAYLLGRYLDLHGKPELAVRCWKRCLAETDFIADFHRTLAAAELLARGIPLEAEESQPESEKTRHWLQRTDAATQWSAGKSYDLGDQVIEISKPLCVGRSQKEFWYPNLARFADGVLAMSIRVGDDRLTEDNALVLWSRNGGLTWTEPKPYTAQSFSYLPLPSGEIALLPHHLYKFPGGCKGPITIINSQGGMRRVEGGVEVTGLPRPTGRDPFNPPADVAAAAKLGRADSTSTACRWRARDGSFLTIVYGIFDGAKRFSTLVAQSQDGLKWHIRSTVADEHCKLSGVEGPCEACLCRLSDGRLMCVFRRGWETYGQSGARTTARPGVNRWP